MLQSMGSQSVENNLVTERQEAEGLCQTWRFLYENAVPVLCIYFNIQICMYVKYVLNIFKMLIYFKYLHIFMLVLA